LPPSDFGARLFNSLSDKTDVEAEGFLSGLHRRRAFTEQEELQNDTPSAKDEANPENGKKRDNKYLLKLGQQIPPQRKRSFDLSLR
jgi:hypothetical protein